MVFTNFVKAIFINWGQRPIVSNISVNWPLTPILYVETEMQYIAIFYNVVFTLNS